MSARSPARAAAESFLVTAGNFLFRYRNAAFPALLIPVVAFFAPVYPWGNERLDHWLDLAVILLALTGEGLRVAVVGLAYIKRGGLNKRVYADTLVTDGLFAHARNPLYVGNILLIAALLIMDNNPWVYLIGGSFFLFAYTAIVAAEEDYLRAKFGAEYEDYCRRVNRWVPSFRGIRDTLRGMTFNWRRVILKEYSSVYVWIVAALALETDETLRNSDLSQEHGYLALLATIFAAATVLFLAVYLAKKRRLLVDPAS